MHIHYKVPKGSVFQSKWKYFNTMQNAKNVDVHTKSAIKYVCPFLNNDIIQTA